MKEIKSRGIRSPSVTQGNKFKYFPNNSNKEFRFYKDCQNLAAEVFKASADAPKEYRFTICKKVHDICCDLIFSVRLANSFELGSTDRKEEQICIMELLQRLDDLLPVIRRCRCITLGQEGEITKRIGNLKFSFEKWLDSDAERIADMGK